MSVKDLGRPRHPGKAQSRPDERVWEERKVRQDSNIWHCMATSSEGLPLCSLSFLPSLPRFLTLRHLFLLLLETLHLMLQGVMGESIGTVPTEHLASCLTC